MKRKLPNFLIVGAERSGTTSLYYYLKEHPQIFTPKRKECRFFSNMSGNHRGPGDEYMNNSIIKNIKDYKFLFEGVSNEKAIGDISPDYLYFYKNSINNINKYLINPKIIIILRNPIKRAYSNYFLHIREERETLSFEEAIKEDKNRRNHNWAWGWYFVDVGFYYNQVKAYLDNFEQVKIYLFDDLKKDTLSLVKDIYGFLGVDTSFAPNVKIRYNVTGIPKNKFIHKFLREPNILKSMVKPVVKTLIPRGERRKIIEKIKMKNLQKPQMKPETREYLKNLYQEDILKLQDLIKRDLSSWLE